MAAKRETTEKRKKLATAHARYLRLAQRKMRLITNMIKNMRVAEALTQLVHTDKKGAPLLLRLINSAAANAKNNFSMDPEKLVIREITCDMGPVMKRYKPRARGAAFVIRKKSCHVNVVLEEKAGMKKISSSRLSFLKKKTESAGAKDKAKKRDTQKSAGPRSDKSLSSRPNEAQGKRRLFSRKSGV